MKTRPKCLGGESKTNETESDMDGVAKCVTELIGNTPMVELGRFSAAMGIDSPIVAKVEFFNPGGSVKDRAAMSMVVDAERRGLLRPGGTIIEPTSGNTGVGLALVAAVRGYAMVLTMPDTMSAERQALARAYGACVVLTPGKEGMAGAIRAAEELRQRTPGAVVLQQFQNQANPDYHYRTTAEEIWRQTGGEIGVFVAAVGTGGTITGIGRRLKELSPGVRVVAVEPQSSPVLSGGKPGLHKIQGIGAGFVPAIYDASVVDEVVTVADADAMETSRRLARTEGLLVGISSGAAAWAAAQVARRPEQRGVRVVTLLPDTGERYLSTELFSRGED